MSDTKGGRVIARRDHYCLLVSPSNFRKQPDKDEREDGEGERNEEKKRIQRERASTLVNSAVVDDGRVFTSVAKSDKCRI